MVAVVTIVALVAGCAASTTEVASPLGTTSAGAPGSTTAGSNGSSPPATDAAGAGTPVPSSGCGTSKVATVTAVDDERHTMAINGVERFYLLTVPKAHDGTKPLSLVFDFHGLGEGAQIHRQMSNLGALATKEGFIAVFPNGTGTPLRWDVNPEHQPNDDLAFVDAMLEQLGADLCVDTSRVYSTGLSYGAIMTSFLLCQRADMFAAVAPVAGLQMPKGCQPKRPVPILTFHGTADPILKFDGTVGDLASILAGQKPVEATTTVPPDLRGVGYPANVAAWAKSNGCDDEPTDANLTESVIRRVYTCPAGADVEFDIILGGGHAWPGSEFSRSIANIVGPTTFEIDASVEAWKFFQRFHLPAR